jgi:AcrR family transcriptional regulator
VTALRRTADERRADVLAAAIEVFAERGCGAPTSAIARRAGVSEAYLFRLFGAKRALLLACHDAVDRRVQGVLGGDDPGEMLRAYGAELTAAERRVQLHLQSAATDPVLRAAVRRSHLATLDGVAARIGPSGARALLGELMAMNLADVLDPYRSH